jgi:hypothetical protein
MLTCVRFPFVRVAERPNAAKNGKLALFVQKTINCEVYMSVFYARVYHLFLPPEAGLRFVCESKIRTKREHSGQRIRQPAEK